MYARYRGIIPAILSLMCAANFAAASITQTASPVGGDDSTLSNPAAFICVDPIQAVLAANNDSSWILRDDRNRMSARAAKVETVTLPNLVSLNDVTASPQPKVDSPDIVQFHSPDVNEMTAPVPVLGVGWAIVLFTVFFYVGARMLRIRKAVAR